MHVVLRRKVVWVLAALVLLVSSACSHAPGRSVDMSRYLYQEHLGLSAGDTNAPPGQEEKSTGEIADPAKTAVVAAEESSTADPAVEKSKQQVREGLSRNAVIYRGEFEDDYGEEEDVVGISDPLKPWNVVWFYFNDAVYQGLLRPLGKGYKYVTPEPVQEGVLNFFYNLKFPIRFVNNLLQGKVTAAGVEMSRFLGNTLFGGLGLMDITEHKKAAAETPPEDFGQTLASWGVGHGFYIVWPLYGPSSVRDTVGSFGDSFLDPITYIDPWFLDYDNPWWWWATAAGARSFVSTADSIDAYDALRDAAIDPYTAFRNAYYQSRMKESKR